MDILATFPTYLFQRAQIESDITANELANSAIPPPNPLLPVTCPDLLALEDSSGTATVLKLLRLFRLTRILNLFDASRMNKLGDTFFSGQTRSKKVIFQLIMKNVYRVFQLILLTVIFTYFIGAFFYLASTLIEPEYDPSWPENNFRTKFNLVEQENSYKIITAAYFSITTLSTVGYGDLYPISNGEKIIVMVIQLLGVAFFSYIMNSFIDIIATFNQNLGNEE